MSARAGSWTLLAKTAPGNPQSGTQQRTLSKPTGGGFLWTRSVAEGARIR